MHEISRARATDAARDSGGLKLARDLAADLGREADLLGDLSGALMAQRVAVATGDAAAVNSNVEGIGRILLAIEEARDRRAAYLQSLPGAGNGDLNCLEVIAGEPLPENLRSARAELRRRAIDVTHEARINQKVLAHALETGEALLMALFSAVGEPEVAYGTPSSAAGKARGAGVLLNRTA